MNNTQRLFIVGGAADKCYVDFLKLAGGPDARIVVLSHASSEPRKAGEAVKAGLKAIGATNVQVLTPRSAGGIDTDVAGIFMAGGDQSRLVKLLDKMGLSEQIRDAMRRGVLVGGSSAGAAACAPVMVAGGMSDRVLRRDSLLLEKGLSLFSGVVIDTHFGERDRHNRLRAAVATLADTVGIGLDEDTALVLDGNDARVVGAGSVHIYQRNPEDDSVHWEDIAAASLHDKFQAGQSIR